MLQGLASGAGSTATVAENYVELARILGVTWRSLQNWRKRKDAPKAAANGFHEVAAWREFMQRHGLEGHPVGSDAESALRARKLLAEVEERELQPRAPVSRWTHAGSTNCPSLPIRRTRGNSPNYSFKTTARSKSMSVPLTASCTWT